MPLFAVLALVFQTTTKPHDGHPPAPPAESAQVAPMTVGGFRHVQLLEVDRSRRAGRFATAYSYRNAPGGRIAVQDLATGATLASMPLGGSPLPFSPRSEPLAWRFFENGERSLVAAIDPRADELVVFAFPAGDELARFEGVNHLLDARATETSIELLVHSDGHVDHITVAVEGDVSERRRLSTGLVSANAAAFAAGGPGQEAVVLGRRRSAGDELEDVLIRSGATTRVEIVQRLAPTQHTAPLRMVAWTGIEGGSEERFVALGDPLAPGPSEGPSEGPNGAVSLLRTDEGGQWFERARLSLPPGGSGFGQALGIVPDADLDGAPDLLISAPRLPSRPVLRRVSSADGRTLDEISFRTSIQLGSSLSLSEDGVTALIGGGDFGEPELPWSPSAVAVIALGAPARAGMTQAFGLEVDEGSTVAPMSHWLEGRPVPIHERPLRGGAARPWSGTFFVAGLRSVQCLDSPAGALVPAWVSGWSRASGALDQRLALGTIACTGSTALDQNRSVEVGFDPSAIDILTGRPRWRYVDGPGGGVIAALDGRSRRLAASPVDGEGTQLIHEDLDVLFDAAGYPHAVALAGRFGERGEREVRSLVVASLDGAAGQRPLPEAGLDAVFDARFVAAAGEFDPRVVAVGTQAGTSALHVWTEGSQGLSLPIGPRPVVARCAAVRAGDTLHVVVLGRSDDDQPRLTLLRASVDGALEVRSTIALDESLHAETATAYPHREPLAGVSYVVDADGGGLPDVLLHTPAADRTALLALFSSESGALLAFFRLDARLESASVSPNGEHVAVGARDGADASPWSGTGYRFVVETGSDRPLQLVGRLESLPVAAMGPPVR